VFATGSLARAAMGARRFHRCMLLVTPIAFGVWSLWLGQDASWDLRNYHWYNAYALLHWRYDQDIAPASIQSYQSPLFDVPWYLLAQIAPARVVGFVIGAIQSANFLLIYAIALRTLPIINELEREITALVLSLFGFLGAVTLNLVGNIGNDLIVSVGELWSVLLVVNVLTKKEADNLTRMFVGGLPLGIAMAGKLTVAPFALGMVMAFFATSLPVRRSFLWALVFGCGVASTFLIIHGPWSLWLWHEFRNPIFPFFNDIFHSPLTNLPDQYDSFRKTPHGVLQWLFFPFFYLNDPTAFGSAPTIDYRFAAANIIFPAGLVARWLLPGAKPMADGGRYLFATVLVFYALWLLVFDYYRYAVAFYMLIPLLIALLVIGLPMSRMPSVAAVAFLFLALALTSKGEDWGRIAWTDKFVEATPEELKLTSDPSKTLLVLLDCPLAYIITLLPPGVSAVQLDQQIAPREPADLPWNVRRHAMIDRHWEAIYGVSSGGGKTWWTYFILFLKSFHLTADLSTCRILKTNLAEVESPDNKPVFCKLERLHGEWWPSWPMPSEVTH
jgi:hypothetical protein